VMQCRRPCMSSFNGVWKQLHRNMFSARYAMHPDTKDEFLLALGLLPLMYFSISSPCSAVVTVSDASLTGGGVCASNQLSWRGENMVKEMLRQPYLDGLDSVGLVECFGGIGGGRRACELAGLHVACHASIEKDL
jgi:hypothetical protein